MICLAMMYHPDQRLRAEAMLGLWEKKYRGKIDAFKKFSCDFTEANEEHFRNMINKSLSRFDYILTIDTDEWILSGEMDGLIRGIGEEDIYECKIRDYVALDKVTAFQRPLHPVVAVRPKKMTWCRPRKYFTEGVKVKDLDLTIHHLMFLNDPEWKKKNYESRGMVDIEWSYLDKIPSSPVPINDEIKQIVGGI